MSGTTLLQNGEGEKVRGGWKKNPGFSRTYLCCVFPILSCWWNIKPSVHKQVKKTASKKKSHYDCSREWLLKGLKLNSFFFPYIYIYGCVYGWTMIYGKKVVYIGRGHRTNPETSVSLTLPLYTEVIYSHYQLQQFQAQQGVTTHWCSIISRVPVWLQYMHVFTIMLALYMWWAVCINV